MPQNTSQGVTRILSGRSMIKGQNDINDGSWESLYEC